MLKRLGVPLVAVLISSACVDADKDTPTAPRGSASRSLQESKSEERFYRTLDERFARVDSVADGFAGMFLDKGTLVIRRKPARATQATIQAAVDTEFGRDMDLAGVPVRFEDADYGWLELSRWYESLRGLLGMDIAHGLDIAEDRNRIVVWTLPEASKDAVLREIETRGVPLHAVEVEATSPGERVAYPPTLRDRVRPLWGGLEVEGGLECTLGFLAEDTYGSRYFVTASHCTARLGAPDGVKFHQNNRTPSVNRVGFEIADPYPFACVDEPDHGCRYSDAALIAIDDSVWWDFGGIARTMNNNGSIVLDPQYWNFELSGHGLAVVGMEVSRVGRTEGWETGTVVQTCGRWIPGDGMALYCQDVVTGEVNPGDSGAPVFIPNLSDGTASLFGIVHTKISQGGQWRYIYSPIFGIFQDLGMFYTFEGGVLPEGVSPVEP